MHICFDVDRFLCNLIAPKKYRMVMNVRVQVFDLLQGAQAATGLVVIIDVFRAFTTACHVAANGARRIIPVAGGKDGVARALAYREGRDDVVIMGERDAVPCEGFDFGNSPALVEDVDFTGKTVVHTTSSGTQGLAAPSGADEVITGSFVNAGAIVEYIRARDPEVVTLVAMGTAGVERSGEDVMCAQYIKNELEGYPNSIEAIGNYLKIIPSAQKFFDPDKDYAPERDFDLCLELDRFDFVLRREMDGDEMRLVSVLPGDA